MMTVASNTTLMVNDGEKHYYSYSKIGKVVLNCYNFWPTDAMYTHTFLAYQIDLHTNHAFFLSLKFVVLVSSFVNVVELN